jgi:hypothetical protein
MHAGAVFSRRRSNADTVYAWTTARSMKIGHARPGHRKIIREFQR